MGCKMNETIEKIARVLCEECFKKIAYCRIDGKGPCLMAEFVSEAIYTEIVEPLEKDKEHYYNTLKFFQHKAEVLERAFELAIVEQIILHPHNENKDLINEIKQEYVEQAEKELQGEKE